MKMSNRKTMPINTRANVTISQFASCWALVMKRLTRHMKAASPICMQSFQNRYTCYFIVAAISHSRLGICIRRETRQRRKTASYSRLESPKAAKWDFAAVVAVNREYARSRENRWDTKGETGNWTPSGYIRTRELALEMYAPHRHAAKKLHGC